MRDSHRGAKQHAGNNARATFRLSRHAGGRTICVLDDDLDGATLPLRIKS